MLSESEELKSFFFFGGITAFSLVFLIFLLLLSLLPLAFEEALGLLLRISFLGGSSEVSLESELLTGFLATFYDTFFSSFAKFLTGFF